ncbi:hypothetical protein ACFSC4_07060 [Deinococcus malanensis]|uniref:hypothetical protein n=1 Tax=Deinococcus malanensis TaxID=1706855 RepID=UPI003640731F
MAQLTLGLGLLGAVYGGLSGGVLGLLTVRASQAWRPALGGLLGFGAVGLCAGVLLGAAGIPDALSGGGSALLTILAAFVTTSQVVGDLLIARGINDAVDAPRDWASDRQLKLTLASLGLVGLGCGDWAARWWRLPIHGPRTRCRWPYHSARPPAARHRPIRWSVRPGRLPPRVGGPTFHVATLSKASCMCPFPTPRSAPSVRHRTGAMTVWPRRSPRPGGRCCWP